MERIPCVVIGAGSVGLAIARAISAAGVPTFVLEKHIRFGEENSSRHSEVIHAGIYYPTNSLKAKFCVEGKSLLSKYVEDRSVPHNKCGKLIIGTEGDTTALKSLYDKGVLNGVKDLIMLNQKEVFSMEPLVSCSQAIHSPSTTIFDSHSVLLNFIADIERNRESSMIYNCEVLKIKPSLKYRSSGTQITQEKTFEVVTSQGVIECQYLINAAGLHSQRIASKIEQYPTRLIPSPYFAKGNYYKLRNSEKPQFQRLIYPLPSQGGLGIHATLDLTGGIRFGPDVEWIRNNKVKHEYTDNNNNNDENKETNEDYRFKCDDIPYSNFAVNERKADLFHSEILKYYPTIQKSDLIPDYAGIRPKLCGPYPSSDSVDKSGSSYVMKSAVDFVIHDASVHGLQGLIQLYGIESPGMTSSMAIAEHVKSMAFV